jgi:hypothetical protein
MKLSSFTSLMLFLALRETSPEVFNATNSAEANKSTCSSAQFDYQGTALCGIAIHERSIPIVVNENVSPDYQPPPTIDPQKTWTISSPHAGGHSSVPFPKMPVKVHALLQKDWNALDERGEEMMAALKALDDSVVEFAHARTTFFEHLQGTFGILAAWGLPQVIRRTGLVHTAYSGELFQFYLLDAASKSDRAKLRGIVGDDGEALSYLFGTIQRGLLCDFASVVNQTVAFATPITGEQTVPHRIEGTWIVSQVDAANSLMVTIADYLDQMVETNGWRDHHQIEEGASMLYPGNGRPAVGFYWFSAVCHAIKDHLEVIPPIFNHCTEVLSVERETEARDAYWNVVMHEASLTADEQIALLYTSIRQNPYISEPHVMLSQLYYRQGEFYRAAIEARSALEKFYVLASAWDKRRSYDHWVGLSRILLLRANRKLEEKSCHLPCAHEHNQLYRTYNDLKLTSLPAMLQEMRDREES